MKNSLQRMGFMQTFITVSLHNNNNNNNNNSRQWRDIISTGGFCFNYLSSLSSFST